MNFAEATSYGEDAVQILNGASIEIGSNTVERSIRRIALNCKKGLGAGFNDGAEHWTKIASLTETAKLDAHHSGVLIKIQNSRSDSQIGDYLPRLYTMKALICWGQRVR